jgi:D-arginine dehydrogenase
VDSDVAVIGGGFAGCATAWWLGRRGVRVIVLERERMLGRYASGRSAGLGRQIVEDDDTTALTVRGANLMRAHVRHAWRETGGILSFDDAALLEQYVARAARFAIPVERLDRAAVLARWPAMTGLAIAGAVHVPSDGVIDVRALLDELSRGAPLRTGVRVDGVEVTKTGVRLATSAGPIETRIVVDAAGAWAGSVIGGAPFEVLKRHVFVVESEPPQGPYLWHVGKGEVYARAEGQAMLVSACDATPETPGDSMVSEAGEAFLKQTLGAAAPALGGLRIVSGWACQRTFGPDRKMRLGRDPDRPWLVWAAGLGGHGATAAVAVGERVAAAVLDAVS